MDYKLHYLVYLTHLRYCILTNFSRNYISLNRPINVKTQVIEMLNLTDSYYTVRVFSPAPPALGRRETLPSRENSTPPAASAGARVRLIEPCCRGSWERTELSWKHRAQACSSLTAWSWIWSMSPRDIWSYEHIWPVLESYKGNSIISSSYKTC